MLMFESEFQKCHFLPIQVLALSVDLAGDAQDIENTLDQVCQKYYVGLQHFPNNKMQQKKFPQLPKQNLQR